MRWLLFLLLAASAGAQVSYAQQSPGTGVYSGRIIVDPGSSPAWFSPGAVSHPRPAGSVGASPGVQGGFASGEVAEPTLSAPRQPQEPARDCLAPAPGHQPLTLTDLEQLALANNPTLPAAAALVQQAQGEWKQVGLYPNPTLGYIRTDPDQHGQSETQGVFFSQDIVTAGKLGIARSAESQVIEQRKWQLNAQQGRVVNDVRSRYYEILGAQQAVTAATELEHLAVEGVRVTEELAKVKQGSRPDVLQAKIQLSTIRTTLETAMHRRQTAWKQLANIVGIPTMQPVALAGTLESEIPQLDWQQSLQQVLEASPVLKAQAAQILAAGYDVKLAKAQAIPNLNVQVVAQHDQVMKFNSVSTLVSLPIPIFNRNQGNILAAKGALQQQLSEYQRVQLALSDLLAADFLQYRNAHSQVERLQKEILPLTKENLDLTTKAYKAGQLDISRVLSARQSYFETHMAYIDALTSLHTSVNTIAGLELTGGLNPTEVGTALQAAPGAGTTTARSALLQQLQAEGRSATRVLPGAVQGR